MSDAHKPHSTLDASLRPECPVCREYDNEDYWRLVEQLEAAHAEIDGLNERIELRAEEDSIYRVYDEAVEQRQAAERRADTAVVERQRWEATTHRLEEQLDSEQRFREAAEQQYAAAEAQYGRLKEQLEATEQRLAREISEHADREQALRQLQFLAVNGQNRHSDSLEALREIESRAREALNPARSRQIHATLAR